MHHDRSTQFLSCASKAVSCVVAVLFTSLTHAQPESSMADPQQSAPANPRPSLDQANQQEVRTLEDEIAELLQNRGEVAAESVPFIDAAIDLRIVDRWLLMASKKIETRAEPRPDARTDARTDRNSRPRDRPVVQSPAALDSSVVITLRRAELRQVITLIDEKARTEKATPLQQASSRLLREITFKLTAEPAGEALDQTLAIVARHAAGVAGVPLPTVMPAMRPTLLAPVQTKPDANQHDTSTPAQLTPAQMKQRVQQISVSVTLRRQIAALCDAAESAPAADAQQITRTLRIVFDMAAALQRNIAVSVETRQALDARLSSAVALYSDARTREAGLSRINALSSYAGISARVDAIPLAAADRQEFAAFFAWSRDAGAVGLDMLSLLEELVDQRAKLSALPKAALSPSLRKGADSARASASAALDLAMDDIKNVGGNGAFASTPQSCTDAAGRASSAVDLALDCEGLAASMSKLAEFRPRSGPAAAPNALERILGVAMVRLSDVQRAEQGTTTIRQTNQLADIATRIASIDPALFTGPVGETYAGITPEQFAITWRQTVNQAFQQLIEKERIEDGVYRRLLNLSEATRLLSEAAKIEATLEQAAMVTKWADWRATRESLGEARQPFAGPLFNAFDKLSKGEEADLNSVRDGLKAIMPLVEVAAEVARYKDAASKLPDDPAGLFLRLATPSHEQPFLELRSISIKLGIGN